MIYKCYAGREPDRSFHRAEREEAIRYIEGHEYIWFLCADGSARRARRTRRLRTWKKSPWRFEASFKYGIYNTFKINQSNYGSLLIPEQEEEG